ncbi:podocalyxin-like protein 2 [Pempheris klunzingeri]|uniref:podocalyxin-like protein 2 n=1 Tax=Pempheris klunzingeri TaxID=3127111 RepID=UPI00397FA232
MLTPSISVRNGVDRNTRRVPRWTHQHREAAVYEEPLNAAANQQRHLAAEGGNDGRLQTVAFIVERICSRNQGGRGGRGGRGTAADMLGPLHITTLLALLAGCDAFTLGLSKQVNSPKPRATRLLQDEGPARPRFIQEFVRTKRHSAQELVRAQPHLVHDMGRPEIHDTTPPRAGTDAANGPESHRPGQDAARRQAGGDGEPEVVDEMERMVHLAVPQDPDSYRGQPDSSDPQRELFSGPGAGDASLEASGFFGTDLEDRERGEEGGEDRERRGGDDERDMTGEDRERRGGDTRGEEHDADVMDGSDTNHTTPDLDVLIGYSPSFRPGFPLPAELHDSGLQAHRGSPVLEVAPLDRELWEAEGEDEGHASGYEALQPSITATTTTTTTTTSTTSTTNATAASGGAGAVGTATPETDTGTDFGLLGSYRKDETEDEETERKEEEEEDTGLTHKGSFTQNPTVPEVGVAPSREPLQPSVEEEEHLEGVGLMDRSDEVKEEETGLSDIALLTTDPPTTIGFTNPAWDWLGKTTPPPAHGSEVMCIDWNELTGRGYVVLNMTHNWNCEEFRVDRGVRLLRIMERVFARRMSSPEGSWVLYLSKPTHQQHQLLMNLASVHGVISTKEVLDMLGEIRTSLNKLGIQNYSAAKSCQSRPSQTRSDYGKLFVVLVIIGSVCMVIITSGFIYICWQRRLPTTKTTFRAEELHFVENGCHDNPTLDVANDSQPEMREKKPSTNGMAGGGGREDSSRWQVFVNQAATEEEEEEQDTHL